MANAEPSESNPDPIPRDFTPRTVNQVAALLHQVPPEDLTSEQILACRKILHLDDPRSVAQRTADEKAEAFSTPEALEALIGYIAERGVPGRKDLNHLLGRLRAIQDPTARAYLRAELPDLVHNKYYRQLVEEALTEGAVKGAKGGVL